MKKFLIMVGLLVCAAAVAADASDTKRVREAMAKVIPAETPDSVTATPVPGLYEVSYGAQLFYVTADGRYLFNGDLVDLRSRANLSDKRRATARTEAIEEYKDSMIVYAPTGETKHTITVFTDIDCGYCRKLHAGMKEMNDLGIAVRYLSYPRAGVGSPSYDKAVSVWCAKDSRKAMDAAKSGGEIAKATCANKVEEHLALGMNVGVNGTPALVLEDGRLVPGYVPPARLLQVLEGKP